MSGGMQFLNTAVNVAKEADDSQVVAKCFDHLSNDINIVVALAVAENLLLHLFSLLESNTRAVFQNSCGAYQSYCCENNSVRCVGLFQQ